VQIRPMRDEDFPEVASLVQEEPHIVRHTNYTYWVLRAMDAEALLVADGPDGLAGFLAGVYQFRTEHALLLQIAVRPAARRTGVGRALAADFSRRALERGAASVLLTIDAGNQTSRSFFQGFADERGWTMREAGDTGTLGGLLDPERIWELRP
jgi:ribosomal protein S18 acetylase RimI-like enzyme